MADDSYLGSLLGWLKGEPAQTPVKETLAPPLAAYPSNDDADYARRYGFSQNNIQQNYLDNQQAKVLGTNVNLEDAAKKYGIPLTKGMKEMAKNQPSFVPTGGAGMSLDMAASAAEDPKVSQVLDLSKNPHVAPDVNNIAMRAALAANRIPVAAVGFDPSRVALDTQSGTGVNIAGAYSPLKDAIYQNSAYPSTMVHESIHRGLEQLRRAHPQEMGKLDTQLPDEEYTVRWLMQNQAGNPESNRGGAAAKQIKTANDLFGDKYYDPALNQLNELAINEMKNKSRRSGPQ